MAAKFDRQKTKHQLFHLSINLGVVLACMTYIHYSNNWSSLGSLWRSPVVPIVFIGELMKVLLCRYYDKLNELHLAQQRRPKTMISANKLQALSGGIAIQLLSTLLFGFLCILLGAPVLQDYEQTFVLATLCTLLSVSPAVFLLGGDGALQVCFCETHNFLSKHQEIALYLIKYNAIGSIAGAWAGSVVAPLDWDRDWQTYPIPNIVGALLGTALCSIYICSRVLYATGKLYLFKKYI